MEELGLDAATILGWFSDRTEEATYTLLRVSQEDAQKFPEELRDAIRRAYISDEGLHRRAVELEQQLQGSEKDRQTQVIAALLPDPSATMAGDFGEIFFYICQATMEHPRVATGPKKWRLKQDRTKPAPKSDVLHFVLPTWPTPSADDEILCAEVKLKSTNRDSHPITKAIDDCAKDRTSRLASTLVWLKERAILESLGTINIAKLDRFIKNDQYQKAQKKFRAVAIISSNLIEVELANVPSERSPDYSLVIISIPNLHRVYNDAYVMAKATTIPGTI